MNEQRGKAWRAAHQRPLDLEEHRDLLVAILDEVRAAPKASGADLARILRRHPLPDGRILAKHRILRAYYQLCAQGARPPDAELVRRLRVKPTRTISGVAPVTVLTEPYPCPGECIFCPDVEHMPKSYLPDEPGAMRAVTHGFDPFDQTASRVASMSELGHNVDKVELLILGGTWSCYPEAYQERFIRRCLDALNETEAPSLELAHRISSRS